ncbi:conjugal transfer protein TraH [Vibrio bivalvicida]|uniref:IncF plasmid conjugative transfer pilus assemblyprotein TraH n=3 Tax=Vibrionaceae TaxID=641 RepID=A0A0H3ZPG8_VIBSP|nr:IncF plasmid conjugative transfer pilus assemblyprotein TraH [Enterovibrio norvegicus]AKN38085.1 IncF plasmid conjugative transfer pilus assemblyprotein TraH [Vibrio splendidus]
MSPATRHVLKGALTLMMCPLAQASTSSSLQPFFDDSGYNANVTNPMAYQGQSANYYSGGSLFVRTKIVNAQWVNATVPSVSAGCSGIDMFMGGFSHISSDELTKLGKAIIHNAPPFIVDLALQTWAPQLKQNMDKLQAVADKWLNQSINSCEAAQATIGGLAALTAPATKKHVCATLGTQNNAFADWVEAASKCNNDTTVNGQLDAANNDPALNAMTMRSHNIVWSAIMKNAYFSSDTDLAQFAMSLSGTFVYDKNGQPRFYPSLLTDDNNMVDALLNGGDIQRYQCGDTSTEGCLTLTVRKVTIPADTAFKVQLQKELDTLWQSVLTDQALIDKQKGFIELIHTPVLKFFFDNAAVGAVPNTPAYANLLAIELLNRYLTNTLNLVEHALSASNSSLANLEAIKNDTARAKQFMVGLTQDAMSLINAQNDLIAAERETQRTGKKQLSKLIPHPEDYQD